MKEQKNASKAPPHHDWRDVDNAPAEVEALRRNVETFANCFVKDDKKARHLCRLALEDGPWHRYETNTAIASILIEVLEVVERKAGRKFRTYDGPVEEVELHLPPHLAGHRGRSYAVIELPVRLLHAVFKSQEAYDYALEALSEGPHHDVAGNAILVMLIEAIYAVIPETRTEEKANNGQD
jgi:hypothetical protein